MAKRSAELCSGVLWKVKIVSCEFEHLAEELWKQSVEGAAWYLLSPYSKVQKERHELKKELLSKMEPELGGLEKFQSAIIARK